MDSQKHYKVETGPGCSVCYCQVYRLPTFCVLWQVFILSVQKCDNRVHDKKMKMIINSFYRVFFIIALSMAALSHRKVASVGT